MPEYKLIPSFGMFLVPADRLIPEIRDRFPSYIRCVEGHGFMRAGDITAGAIVGAPADPEAFG